MRTVGWHFAPFKYDDKTRFGRDVALKRRATLIKERGEGREGGELMNGIHYDLICPSHPSPVLRSSRCRKPGQYTLHTYASAHIPLKKYIWRQIPIFIHCSWRHLNLCYNFLLKVRRRGRTATSCPSQHHLSNCVREVCGWHIGDESFLLFHCQRQQ